MIEIILDTETTGLDPHDGHRIVEIGCVEIMNCVPTGRVFHHYINPERDMPSGASAVHGLTDEFLADKPVFSAIAGDFIEFIAEAPLVIHNAAFDIGFLNMELKKHGFMEIAAHRAVDTVDMARRKFPGQRASLDALCERFGVDRSARTFHGALLDAHLLAEVYLELRGGRQPGLVIEAEVQQITETIIARQRKTREPRAHAPLKEEIAAHAAFVAALTNPLWQQD